MNVVVQVGRDVAVAGGNVVASGWDGDKRGWVVGKIDGLTARDWSVLVGHWSGLLGRNDVSVTWRSHQ